MRKEIIWGITVSIFVVLLTIYYVMDYQKQNEQIQRAVPTPSPSLSSRQKAVNVITADSNTQLTSTPVPVNNTPLLTADVVAKHSSLQDCWFIINNKVYDLTSYVEQHPGGRRNIATYCGQDATTAYMTKGGRGSHSSMADEELSPLYIGDVNGPVPTGK
ncbi:hypothetical protein HGB07_04000 [Candidatus Roizmanbacteria bacterium]|nr:hypothetical protein [Candidatus Roizmanbacteria bacterium]